MKKIIGLGIVAALASGAFFAGLAVGKGAADASIKFTPVDDQKWDDLGGPKMATISGDYKKGPYTGLLKLPGGFTSPMHTHSGSYEAILVTGSMTHWIKGEDGSKAPKLNPGSYWTVPAKLEHISACAKGPDCVIYVWQKTKFDFTVTDAPAGAGSGSGSGAKTPAKK
jgi:hypothetical protein